MSLVLLLAASEGHVRLNYIDGSDMPIRNAGTATGNGRASVAGACGGENQWGTNGNAVGQDGMEITMNLQYAAGHTGTFEMAYSCGGTTEDDLSAAGAKLAGCTCEKNGAASTYPCPGMNAGDEGVVTCTLPSQALAVGDTADCTVSVLDQRDWGGCVDVQMVSAAAILPPSPPPAPLVSNAGVYKLTTNTVIDNSAATFTCCALEAELNVPEYELGLAASFTATLSGKANGCRTQSLPVTSPTDNDMVIEMQVPLNIVTAGGGKYSGTVLLGTPSQPFEFEVDNGVLSFTNTAGDNDPEAQPIICDGFSSTGDAKVSGNPASNIETDEGNDAGAAAGAVIAVIIVLGICAGGYWYMKKGAAPGKGAPMPPPPPGTAPGWAAAVDPSSGRTYYVNSATGQSQWEPPV